MRAELYALSADTRVILKRRALFKVAGLFLCILGIAITYALALWRPGCPAHSKNVGNTLFLVTSTHSRAIYAASQNFASMPSS